MGDDVTVTLGGQAGNFRLNVMLPVIAYNPLQSVTLLAARPRSRPVKRSPTSLERTRRRPALRSGRQAVPDDPWMIRGGPMTFELKTLSPEAVPRALE